MPKNPLTKTKTHPHLKKILISGKSRNEDELWHGLQKKPPCNQLGCKVIHLILCVITFAHLPEIHYFKADSESKTCGNPTKDQRADHLSANASNFKPTRDFIKSPRHWTHTHQNWPMDKWEPADVGETFDNVLVSIAVNKNFLSEKGGPLERIITERGNNFTVQLHVSTFIKLYFAAPRFRC